MCVNCAERKQSFAGVQKNVGISFGAISITEKGKELFHPIEKTNKTNIRRYIKGSVLIKIIYKIKNNDINF